jgi:hypothetical protein
MLMLFLLLILKFSTVGTVGFLYACATCMVGCSNHKSHSYDDSFRYRYPTIGTRSR